MEVECGVVLLRRGRARVSGVLLYRVAEGGEERTDRVGCYSMSRWVTSSSEVYETQNVRLPLRWERHSSVVVRSRYDANDGVAVDQE